MSGGAVLSVARKSQKQANQTQNGGKITGPKTLQIDKVCAPVQ
jgi:hypothetical protein